jgi:dihydrofolate reductase/thymidylate synthase
MYREALHGPGCEAIHITEIEASIECDTFMPRIDFSVFHPWYSSFPLVENGLRYSFTTYVRVRYSTEESQGLNTDPILYDNSKPLKFEVKNFSFLPKFIFERHEEYKYLRLVEEIISEGTTKDDRTGTGTVSKFGSKVTI